MASASLTSETEKRTGRRFEQISRRYARLEDVLMRGRAAFPLLFAFSLYATSPLAPTLGVTASSLWVRVTTPSAAKPVITRPPMDTVTFLGS